MNFPFVKTKTVALPNFRFQSSSPADGDLRILETRETLQAECAVYKRMQIVRNRVSRMGFPKRILLA